MKKKLEAELISIAHRILKLKNKSELDQLYVETQKLYEKLAVLKFVEQNFAEVKPTIGRAEAEEILETAFDEPVAEAPQPEAKVESVIEKPEVADTSADEKTVAESPQPDKEDDKEDKDDNQDEQKIQEPEKPEEEKLAPDATPIEKEADEVIAEAEEAVASDKAETEVETETEPEEAPVTESGIDFEQPEVKEEIAAAAPEEAKQDDLFKPSFEWVFDAKGEEKEEDKTPSQQTSQVAFEDLLGAGYKDPVFVKPEDEKEETDVPAENSWVEPTRIEQPETKADVIPITRRDDKIPVYKMHNETGGTINDRMSKGITVGLNDRIAFVKNLFNNSNEEYNRVLSQLLTFDTYEEAQDFIDNMVKPDYNNWEGKDDYAQRFMEVIEKKFT
jgi:hypothetical protein